MPSDLHAQQREWLAEAYSGLLPLACAIACNIYIAEEVVSQALLSALTQIAQDKCRATCKGQLFLWVRTITRNRAKTAIGAGKDRKKRRSLCRGDILADLHAENIRKLVTPDPVTEDFPEESEQLETG